MFRDINKIFRRDHIQCSDMNSRNTFIPRNILFIAFITEFVPFPSNHRVYMMFKSTRLLLLLLSTFIISHQNGNVKIVRTEKIIHEWDMGINWVKHTEKWAKPRRRISTESHCNANMKNYSFSFCRDSNPCSVLRALSYWAMENILIHIVVPLGYVVYAVYISIRWHFMDAMTTITMQTTLFASKSDFRMTQFNRRAIALMHSRSQQNEKYENDTDDYLFFSRLFSGSG